MDRRAFLSRALAWTAGAVTATWARVLPAHAKATTVFADTFNRGNTTSGWGAAWHNQRWGNGWGIKSKKAFYELPEPQGGAGTYNPNPILAFDNDATDVDIKAEMSTDNAAARFGLVARAIGYSEFYAAYVDAGELKIVRAAVNRELPLPVKQPKTQFLPFAITPNKTYLVRFKVTGSNPVKLAAKVWLKGAKEPKAFNLSVTDSERERIATKAGGQVGVFFMHDDKAKFPATFTIDSFKATTTKAKKKSPPRNSFAFSGITQATASGVRTRVVAKSDTPSTIKFHLGTDPQLKNFEVIDPDETFKNPGTAKAWLPALQPGTTYRWRAVATARNKTKLRTQIREIRVPGPDDEIAFAFGSCTHLYPRSVSFSEAAKHNPVFFAHLGDFGYPHAVEQASMALRADCFQDRWTRMLDRRAMEILHRKSSFIMSMDDHDYGVNGGFRDTVREFTIEAWGGIHGNGIDRGFFDAVYGDVHCFFLDVHRYADNPESTDSPSKSILGQQQKDFLKDGIRNSTGRLIVVFAPMAFFGPGPGGITWKGAFKQERNELIGFFAGQQAGNRRVLLCTGNTHSQFISIHPNPDGGKQVIEFGSSGTDRLDSTKKTALPNDPTGILDNQRGMKLIDAFGLVTVSGSGSGRTVTLRSIEAKTGQNVWPPLSVAL